MTPKLCVWCHREFTPLLKRKMFCTPDCGMMAREALRMPAKAMVTRGTVDTIICNHCSVLMASGRELRQHKQSLGLTRGEEVRSEIGSSLDGVNL